MDYKQHKGSLRGQIKNKVERKLYNKRIRVEAIDVDTSERQLTIPDVSKFVTCYTCNATKGKLPEGDNYCNMCDHYF